GIALGIVQFFYRFCSKKARLHFIAPAGGIFLFPGTHRRRFPQIIEMLSVNTVRHIVTDVAVLLVPNSAAHVYPLIHPAAKHMGVLRVGCFLGSQEGMALE